MGSRLAETLGQQGLHALYVHGISPYTVPGQAFYALDFFEKPILQTQFLLGDLELRIREDLNNCEVGIVDRYIISACIYQTNKTVMPEEQRQITQLIAERAKNLPTPTKTFILDISYATLCERYLSRYGKPPKEKHIPYLKRLIDDFSRADGIHINNNSNLDSNLAHITSTALSGIIA